MGFEALVFLELCSGRSCDKLSNAPDTSSSTLVTATSLFQPEVQRFLCRLAPTGSDMTACRQVVSVGEVAAEAYSDK